jgi:hypothetical protein
MRVRCVSTFGLAAGFALAGLGATGLAGDEPKKFDLGVPNRWEKDEVVTVTDSMRTDMTMTIRRANGTTGEQKQSKRKESVVVWRCLETDDEGKRLRAHAFVRSWTAKDDKGEDTSVAGAFVEVTPGKWTMLSPGVVPSAAGKKWLDKTFGPRSKEEQAGFDSMGAPPSLAVGESWSMPPEALSTLLGATIGDEAGLDLSKVECTVKLLAAEETPKGPRLRAALKLGGPIGGSFGAAKGQALTVGKGSRFSFDGEIAAVLGGSHRDESIGGPIEMKLLVSKDGNDVDSTMTARMEKTRVPGGEMPDPPKAEEATPPAPPAPSTEPAPK